MCLIPQVTSLGTPKSWLEKPGIYRWINQKHCVHLLKYFKKSYTQNDSFLPTTSSAKGIFIVAIYIWSHKIHTSGLISDLEGTLDPIDGPFHA